MKNKLGKTINKSKSFGLPQTLPSYLRMRKRNIYVFKNQMNMRKVLLSCIGVLMQTFL